MKRIRLDTELKHEKITQ